MKQWQLRYSMNFTYPTNCLPPEILGVIFQFLPDQDRLPVSRVCRQWRDVMAIPQLWRIHAIDFNGECFFPKFNIAHFKYVEHYLPYIRHLKLRFNSFTKASAMNFKKVMNLWLRRNRQTPFKFSILSVSIEKSWNNMEARASVLRDLVRLLQKQFSLEVFDISLLSLTNSEAEILLETLSVTCNDKINALYFNKFLSFDLSDRIISQITDFPNLQILKMNYADLSSELLHLISAKYENKFKKLILKGIQEIETDPAFSLAWRLLTKQCPDLIVTYDIRAAISQLIIIAQGMSNNLFSFNFSSCLLMSQS